jgi:hypothetical protein
MNMYKLSIVHYKIWKQNNSKANGENFLKFKNLGKW